MQRDGPGYVTRCVNMLEMCRGRIYADVHPNESFFCGDFPRLYLSDYGDTYNIIPCESVSKAEFVIEFIKG